MIKYIITIIAVLAFAASSFAQQTATATSGGSVVITSPTSILKTADMDFGKINIPTNKPGSTVIDPKANKNKNKNDNDAPDTTSALQPAVFTVNAPAGYTYNITFPNKPVYEDDSSSQLLNITNFNSDPPNTDLNTGTQTYNVGATVNYDKADEQGAYKAEIPFDVTVGYN